MVKWEVVQSLKEKNANGESRNQWPLSRAVLTQNSSSLKNEHNQWENVSPKV